MMKIQHGVDRHVAFIYQPEGDALNCEQLIVGWGVRNRVADPLVVFRAKWAHRQVYGDRNDIDINRLFSDDAGQADRMISGADWCSNIRSENTDESILHHDVEDALTMLRDFYTSVPAR